MNEREISKTLWADYIYIFVPFFLLIAIKLYTGNFDEIITSPDWSLASTLIIGQSQSKIIRATISSRKKVNDAGIYYYFAKSFLLTIISLLTYVLMLVKPIYFLGIFQIIYFTFASFLHFTDGRAARIISDN